MSNKLQFVDDSLIRLIGRRDKLKFVGHVTGLARLFAEDGVRASQRVSTDKGSSSNRAGYAGARGPLSLRAIAFAAEGGVGYIIGGYAWKKGEPDSGKFTLTLRKGNRWEVADRLGYGQRKPAALVTTPEQAIEPA